MTTVEIPDDRVTESLVNTIIDAYPDFSLTSHHDDNGNYYLMVQVPHRPGELNQQAPGDFVSMVSELDRTDGNGGDDE